MRLFFTGLEKGLNGVCIEKITKTLLESFQNPTPSEDEEISIIDKFVKKYSSSYNFDSDDFKKILIMNIDCRVLNYASVTSEQVCNTVIIAAILGSVIRIII